MLSHTGRDAAPGGSADDVLAGASIQRRISDDDYDYPVYFVVLQDPEGNEFCVS
jgi:Glyoxalase-like domain